MGVQPGIVEKDIWVCTVLQRLFSDMHLKNHLVFKGGTSLSKVYKLIRRFSEDVDLILDWRLFGYGNGELDPYIPRESKTKQDRFNKKIVKNASIYLHESFVPDVKELFSDITGVDVRISENDPNAAEVHYPSLFDVPYVRDRVLLEIGPLASWIPSVWQKIRPYVSEIFPTAVENISIDVLSTTAERTFWEKTTILHTEAHRTNTIPSRYSRHYYDVYKMASSWVKQTAFEDISLLEEVVSFKQLFYPSKWARYDLAVPGTFKLLPEKERVDELEKDYKEMKAMIFEEAPLWESIVETMVQLEGEINSINES
jgi:hypothetical protein